MAKQLQFNEEARKSLVNGVEKDFQGSHDYSWS